MTYKVMLADDEPIMRKALQSLINWGEIGCEVVLIANNGEEVLAHLEEMMPDILIVDIKMPGKGGIELAKYIWERKLPVRVILLTAFADFSYAQSAIRYNVFEYVTKTGAFDDLLRAVDNCINAIEEERNSSKIGIKSIQAENFFKGVYDGSIFDEIAVQFGTLSIAVEKYAVLFFQFLIDDGIKNIKRKRINGSLKTFFEMAFSDQIVQGMFLHKDIYGLVLHQNDLESTREKLLRDCKAVMDMMDNFMELYVYIGISNIHDSIEELPLAYEEAGLALKHSCLENSEKMNFYHEDMRMEEISVLSTDHRQQLLKDCMDYIEKHYEKNILVTDIAHVLGTSASYLSRVFKESTGKTIIQTINQKKMERAEEYLKSTDLKIYEIADALGFENITYFSRFFKKHKGISAKEYKEKCKG